MDAEVLRSIMVRYGRALVDHQDALDGLNVFPVADADTGTNLARTMAVVIDELDGVPVGDLAGVAAAVADGSLLGARGNSGVILSQYLRAFLGPLCEGGDLVVGLEAGAEAAREAVAEPVEGTVLTVASAAAAGAADARGGSPVDVLASARLAAADALARTPGQLPALAAAGVVDAGGAGLLLLLDAALDVLDGRPVPPTGRAGGGVAVPAAAPGGDAGPRYEVTFLLAADETGVTALRAAWTGLGDSIAVSGGGGRWRCHVHTDDIGAALEAAVDAGRPSGIRVEDLHAQIAAPRPGADPDPRP